jgi:hypothetical protein
MAWPRGSVSGPDGRGAGTRTYEHLLSIGISFKFGGTIICFTVTHCAAILPTDIPRSVRTTSTYGFGSCHGSAWARFGKALASLLSSGPAVLALVMSKSSEGRDPSPDPWDLGARRNDFAASQYPINKDDTAIDDSQVTKGRYECFSSAERWTDLQMAGAKSP